MVEFGSKHYGRSAIAAVQVVGYELSRELTLFGANRFGSVNVEQVVNVLSLPQSPAILTAQFVALGVFLAHRVLHEPLLDKDGIHPLEILTANFVDGVQGLCTYLAPAIVVNVFNHEGDIHWLQYVAGAAGLINLGLSIKGFIPNREKGDVENEAVVTEVEKPKEKNISDRPTPEQVNYIASFYMEKGMPEAKAKERAMNCQVHRSQ